MNQVDKEYMQNKGFLDDQEQAVDSALQSAALMEPVEFAGALLAKGDDMSVLQTVSAYLEDLAGRKEFLHMHLYVQRTYGNCRGRGELDGFYAASLHDDALFVYAAYFVVYLSNLVSKLNETMLSIEVNKTMAEINAARREKTFVPHDQENGGRADG